MERTKINMVRTKQSYHTCKCGCGNFTKKHPWKRNTWNIYIRGHYAKDPNRKNKSGWHHTSISKQKISESRMGIVSPRKGVVLTEETKQKIRLCRIGKPLSQEHKDKIRDTTRKTYENPEIRKKCSHDQIISEKHKQIVKDFMLNAWQNPVFRNKLILNNANNWQGGLSFDPYSTEFNNSLKKYIRNRDNNECQNPNCLKQAKNLNIHHIDYIKTNCSEYNLITICCSCNVKANFKRDYWKSFYQKIINRKYNGKIKRKKIS